MRSFFKNVINQKQTTHALLGRLVQVGPYNLRVESHISDGGFAAIYKVRDNSTGKTYALKHMRLMGDSDAIADCMTEINALKALRHVPSVISLRAAAFTGSKGQEQEAYLVLDLCSINLAEYINSLDKAMSTATIVEIFSCVCQAVSAMHQQSPPLAHRDLKPENVLQHTEGGWVLCDFGSVTDKPSLYDTGDQMMMGEEVMRKYTTPAYRAPEMWDLYSRERIDTKADIWALGCLLYFLMYGKLAFQAEAKLQILNGDVIIPPSRPPPLVELLRELLVVSPQRRPDILQVLRRLQEVAERLNVDPALLIPTTPVPSGNSKRRISQPGAEKVASLQDRPPSFEKASISSATDFQPKSVEPQIKPSAPLVQPISSRKFTQEPSNAFVPPNPPSGGMAPVQQGFANFEQAFSSNNGEVQGANISVSAPQQKPKVEPLQNPQEVKHKIEPVQKVQEVKHSLPSNRVSENSLNSSFRGRSHSALSSHSPSVSPPHGRSKTQTFPEHNPKQGTNLGQQILALQRQLADSNSQNKSLKATLQSQEALIHQLQNENQAYILQLQSLGLEPELPNQIPAKEIPASSDQSGWASFENSFESNAFGHTTHRFDTKQRNLSQEQFQNQPDQIDSHRKDFAQEFLGESEVSKSQGGPVMSQTLPNLKLAKGTISPHGRRSSASSPLKRHDNSRGHLSQTAPAKNFDGIGVRQQNLQGIGSEGNSPKTDPFSLGSPSETMSRKSAFSAFEESLKQPALSSKETINPSSPLSESGSQDSRTKSLPRFSKRTHRRSTSEPVAIENWNLIKDQAD